MRKNGVIFTAIALLATACSILPDAERHEKGKGSLELGIARYYDAQTYKSSAMPDTNAFILTVADLAGTVYYTGPYGDRPASIQLSEGTYDISLVSADYSAAAFDSPQWGTEIQADIVADETTRVILECTQLNSGVRIVFGPHYKDVFGASPVKIVYGEKELQYDYEESRYAYFPPGEVRFDIVSATGDKPIFKRTLHPGVNLTINLDASSDSGESVFSVIVGTNVIYESEDIVTDGTFFQEDGLTPRTAFCIDSAARHVGDTVWVWGYIVGGDCSAADVNFFQDTIASTTHFAIAASKAASKRSECMAVELGKKALRAELNLKDNPQLQYRKIYLRGKVANYMGSWPGIKNLIEYRF